MKKLLVSTMIVILLFNFICCSGTSKVFAEDPEKPQSNSSYLEEGGGEIQPGTVTDVIEEGEADGSTMNSTSFGISGIGAVIGLLARILNVLFALQIDIVLGSLTSTTEVSGDSRFFFTIDRCVFNRISLFNINYFNYDDTYKVGDIEIKSNPSNISIKESVVDVYFICRSVALLLLLLILIYIGIRMALSTIASDQAKYKQMLMAWIESVILLFALIYIISFIINFGELLTGIFFKMRNSLIASSTAEHEIFEDAVRDEAMLKVFETSGIQVAMWSLVYWALLFSEVKFFWLYIKRVLMTGLLITIAPLITITYSIDKVGDGKAQVFSTWFKEFTVNILIQPLHALIYLIFIITANEIAAQSPLVALALLISMGSVERMVKVIFNMKGLVTLRGVNKFMKKEG